jgi:hypothetical protein
VPAPNPQPGPDLTFSVQLSQPADSLDLKVYTQAFRLVGETSWSGLPYGWNSLDAKMGDLAGGVYYAIFRASRSGATIQAKPCKLYLKRG